MSSTTPDPERPVPPDSVFERLVWTNPEVCNNCFQRCRRVTTVEGEEGDASRRREPCASPARPSRQCYSIQAPVQAGPRFDPRGSPCPDPEAVG